MTDTLQDVGTSAQMKVCEEKHIKGNRKVAFEMLLNANKLDGHMTEFELIYEYNLTLSKNDFASLAFQYHLQCEKKFKDFSSEINHCGLSEFSENDTCTIF